MHTDEQRALKPVQELPSPRLIKSHLPLALLPVQLWQKKAKVVYVFRNPKDAWVSAYYHGVTIGYNYGLTLEQFFNGCLDGENIKLESIEHAAEFYQLRNEPWVYYTSFERMKLDLRAVIEDLCKFLGKTVTEQQMERLLKHLSFEEMKSKSPTEGESERFCSPFIFLENPTTNHNWELADVKHENALKTIYK